MCCAKRCLIKFTCLTFVSIFVYLLVKTITCEQAHHFEWRAKLAVRERVSERVNQGQERRYPPSYHWRLLSLSTFV